MYLLYFATIVSGTQIPYDALGQELTDDYDTRAKLFTWKPISGLLGGGVATLLLMVFQSMYPNDSAQASVMTMLATVVIGAVAYALRRPPSVIEVSTM